VRRGVSLGPLHGVPLALKDMYYPASKWRPLKSSLDRRFSLAAMAFNIMGLPPSGKRQFRLACG